VKKLFTFKKLSTQITFLVGTIILIVAGGVAGYMQFRIITEIGRHSHLNLQYKLLELEEKASVAFIDAVYKTESIKNLASAYFNLDEYKEDPENYVEQLNEAMGGFIYNTINEFEYITAAYFILHPDLAGEPFVVEIFYVQTDDGIVFMDEFPLYEDYDESDPDMQWFYGAYNTGNPYWSPVYADETGVTMVSYTIPVFVGGVKVGVAGVDIAITNIENLIREVSAYKTGFAFLEDRYGEFFETNELIGSFSAADKERLSATAGANIGEVFEINLDKKYMASALPLINDYTLYIIAPKSEVNAEVTASLTRFSVIFVVAYTIVLIVAFIIGKRMGRPLAALSAFMRRAGTTGDILYTPEDEQALNSAIENGGEIGQLVKDSGVFIDHIIAASGELESIANGDLTVEIKALSGQDTMANSLNKMIENLNKLFNEVHNSATQVSNGSSQISNGASSLSSGAVEQAASIEELSTSIENIRIQTSRNAEIAKQAAVMSDEISANAEKGSAQMNHMIQAVTEINAASEQISRVIKVIDDIAFQTNILALNAAVEAARAGQHGKGFAVVAEEVRNLASKSAEAAKNTGGLIENSVEKANLGMSIAAETADSLKEIVTGINHSAETINKIAEECHEQANLISMLNNGIEQVSQIVQQNSAAAQESAASSQEMNAQSVMLENLISQFKLKGGNTGLRK
jgi:methyl-accepting chemotaxis protein